MKVIYRRRKFNQEELQSVRDAYVLIKPSGAGLAISMVNAAGNNAVLDVQFTSYKNETMTHVFWSTADQGFIQYEDAARWRDLQSHLWFNDGCKYGMSIIITKVCEQVFVDTNGLPIYAEDGVELIQEMSGISPIRTLAKQIDGLEQMRFIKEIRARADLMRDINPVDIMSDLEKQVDLLTEIVLQMAESVPCDKPSWFAQFKNAYTVNSSLQFKLQTACIENMAATKAKIRALQSKLFNTING